MCFVFLYDGDKSLSSQGIKPTSHHQVKVPPRLLQKTPAGLLHCLCISLPTARHMHPLLVLVERWCIDAAESFRQETICHFNQSLVMHRWLQAHTPPGLLLKLCE